MYFPVCAGAVFLISVISVVVSLIQTRRNLQQLHDLIAQSCTVTVLRGGKGGSHTHTHTTYEYKTLICAHLNVMFIKFLSALWHV